VTTTCPKIQAPNRGLTLPQWVVGLPQKPDRTLNCTFLPIQEVILNEGHFFENGPVAKEWSSLEFKPPISFHIQGLALQGALHAP